MIHTNLIARLRTPPFGTETSERNLMTAAADALTALEAENRRLREALHKIEAAPAWGYPDRWETTPAEVRQLARAALRNTEASHD